MRRRITRAVVAGVMGTIVGVSAGLVFLHAAAQTVDVRPASVEVVQP